MRRSDDKELQQLIEQQYALAARVVLRSPFPSPAAVQTVGGLDVAYEGEEMLSVACAVVDLDTMSIVEEAHVRHAQDRQFPYIPGFFAFREMPALLEAVHALKTLPDVFLCDGQGIAHPRRCGLASHLGVTLQKPTIGCAKTHFYGEFTEPPPGVKGAYQYLRDDGDVLGIVLRTKPYVKPVFVSPGHLMDVETAGDIVMRCTTRFRIPEPLRRAHTLATQGMK